MRLGYALGAIAAAAAAAGEVCLARSVLVTDPEAALGEFITAFILAGMAIALVREAFSERPVAHDHPGFQATQAPQAAGNSLTDRR